jgi:hypothetical protein
MKKYQSKKNLLKQKDSNKKNKDQFDRKNLKRIKL